MILFVLFLVFITISCVDENKSTPNIVWLVTEDQSQYFFPFYGDNSVILPNISGLLKNGIVYDDMNSTYPVCAPARSAIITGMYPNSIGTGNMRAYNSNRKVRPETESSLEVPYYSSKFAEAINETPDNEELGKLIRSIFLLVP